MGFRHANASAASRLLTTFVSLFLSLALGALAPSQPTPNLAKPQATPDPAIRAEQPVASSPGGISASRQAANPCVITIDGPIDSITAHSIRRRLAEAADLKADAIVFDLDTPGGELGAILEISGLIKQSPIRNTIAWIHPQAYSGGAIIALACREIVVSNPASFGDAKVIKPVFDRASFSTQIQGMNNDERQKLLPPLLADVVDSARRHNRAVGAYKWDELIVQAFVATDAELWWVQDNQTGARFAVDRAEFERLFPDQPVLQPLLATASVGSNEKATQGAGVRPIPRASPRPDRRTPGGKSGDDTPLPRPDETTPFTPAAPSLHDIKASTDQALDLAGAAPSLRPATQPNDAGRYTLVAKICNGDGAIVLRDQEMAYFQFATNTVLGSDGAPVLKPINTDADLQAFLGARTLTRLDESWSESLSRSMSAAWLRGLLIAGFLICLFVEFLSPGVTVPGVIAGCCLVGLFLPPVLVGLAIWWQLAAILLGLVLLATELLLLPGFGLPGVLGLLSLLAGLIGVFIPGSSGIGATAAEFRSSLATGVTTMLLAGVTASIALFFIYRNLGTLPILKHLVLQNPEFDSGGEGSMLAAMGAAEIKVGDRGIAVTPLRPAGKIEINGRLHDVVAEFGFIDRDKSVRVVSVTEFRVGVEEAQS
jgi:membrane-bound ClpP family serine protease